MAAMAHGAWCNISVHMRATPMVQRFRAHVCHTHGAERTRTYRAHTRVHVHIPCTYTPSACISDFDASLKISCGPNFVFFPTRLESYTPDFFQKKRQKSKVEDLAKWEKSVNLQGLSPGGDKSSTRFWDFWRQGRGEVEHKYLSFLGFH